MTLVNIDPDVIPQWKMHVSAVLIFEPDQLPLQYPVLSLSIIILNFINIIMINVAFLKIFNLDLVFE